MGKIFKSIEADYNYMTLEESAKHDDCIALHIDGFNVETIGSLTVEEALCLSDSLKNLAHTITKKRIDSIKAIYKLTITSHDGSQFFSHLIDESDNYREIYSTIGRESVDSYYQTGTFYFDDHASYSDTYVDAYLDEHYDELPYFARIGGAGITFERVED
jgi:hypothetical protein